MLLSDFTWIKALRSVLAYQLPQYHCCIVENDNHADVLKYNQLLFFLLCKMYVWVECERERELKIAEYAHTQKEGPRYESGLKPLLPSFPILYFHKTGTGPPQGIEST